MAATLAELIKQKRELWYKAQDIVKLAEQEERTMSPEEHELWNNLTVQMDDLQKTIDVREQMNEMNSKLNEPAKNARGETIGSVEEQVRKQATAIHKWMKLGSTGLTAEERKAIGIETLGAGREQVELRSITNIANPSYVVTVGVMDAIERAKKYYGGWWEGVTVWKTAKGGTMYWPTVDDTSYTGAKEAIGTSIYESADAVTLGRKQFDSYIYSSQGVAVGLGELEDADFDVGTVLGDILGERLWRAASTATTTTNGSSAPNGIGYGSAKGVLGGDCTITRARILQLMSSVDYGYHLSPKAGFMMSHSQLMAIRSVLDGDNRPLWQPSMIVGSPDTIEGFRYWINNDLTAATTVSAASRHILFGDLSKFVVRLAGPTILQRLNERYADQLQVGFAAIQRLDSEFLNANTTTYAPIKYLRRMDT